MKGGDKMAQHTRRQAGVGEENENLMAALSYLLFFITGITFLFLERKSEFVRFHAMQSTLTFGFLFIAIIVFSFIPYIGDIINFILWLLSVLLWIVLMVKAFAGEKYKLPYIGQIAERQLKSF